MKFNTQHGTTFIYWIFLIKSFFRFLVENRCIFQATLELSQTRFILKFCSCCCWCFCFYVLFLFFQIKFYSLNLSKVKIILQLLIIVNLEKNLIISFHFIYFFTSNFGFPFLICTEWNSTLCTHIHTHSYLFFCFVCSICLKKISIYFSHVLFRSSS